MKTMFIYIIDYCGGTRSGYGPFRSVSLMNVNASFPPVAPLTVTYRVQRVSDGGYDQVTVSYEHTITTDPNDTEEE